MIRYRLHIRGKILGTRLPIEVATQTVHRQVGMSQRSTETLAVTKHSREDRFLETGPPSGPFALNPLSRRTFPHELLDEGSHPDVELFGTFQDMRRVNRWLGGLDITLRGLERLTGHLRPGGHLNILDIGTGHGDIPRAICGWTERRGLTCQAIGVDLDRSTITTAMQLPENREIDFIQGDILALPIPDKSVDVAMSSMTLHHLSDEEAVAALLEKARVSRLGIIVNDLSRTVHGFAVAWLLGRVATNNRLTRHDAHRSILRGRTEDELRELAVQAGLQPPVFDKTLGYRLAMTAGVRQW